MRKPCKRSKLTENLRLFWTNCDGFKYRFKCKYWTRCEPMNSLCDQMDSLRADVNNIAVWRQHSKLPSRVLPQTLCQFLRGPLIVTTFSDMWSCPLAYFVTSCKKISSDTLHMAAASWANNSWAWNIRSLKIVLENSCVVHICTYLADTQGYCRSCVCLVYKEKPRNVQIFFLSRCHIKRY